MKLKTPVIVISCALSRLAVTGQATPALLEKSPERVERYFQDPGVAYALDE